MSIFKAGIIERLREAERWITETFETPQKSIFKHSFRVCSTQDRAPIGFTSRAIPCSSLPVALWNRKPKNLGARLYRIVVLYSFNVYVAFIGLNIRRVFKYNQRLIKIMAC